jgi:hypothetical protein
MASCNIFLADRISYLVTRRRSWDLGAEAGNRIFAICTEKLSKRLGHLFAVTLTILTWPKIGINGYWAIISMSYSSSGEKQMRYPWRILRTPSVEA